jgi:hypothetical protein
VQAVGQLDQDNPDILAIARNILRKFSAWISSLDEYGIRPSLVTPSTREATSSPKRAPAPRRKCGVLDGVVQQGGYQGIGVNFQFRQDLRCCQWVDDVGFTCDAPLLFMGSAGKFIRIDDPLAIVLTRVFLIQADNPLQDFAAVIVMAHARPP